MLIEQDCTQLKRYNTAYDTGRKIILSRTWATSIEQAYERAVNDEKFASATKGNVIKERLYVSEEPIDALTLRQWGLPSSVNFLDVLEEQHGKTD